MITKTAYNAFLDKYARRVVLLCAALLIAAGAALPFLSSRSADAAQITSRSLTISSGVPSLTGVQYTFTFTIPSTAQVQGMKFLACTTAVGTCTAPTGLSLSSVTWVSQSGWQGATNFAVDLVGANDCLASASIACVKRTDTTAQTATSRTLALGTITNPSTANTAFFVRMTTYTTNTWTAVSITDTGTVASAVVQTLTINAAVAEILNFCVGSTTVNDATTSVASDCTGVSGTSVNIGTLDPSTINTSPVGTNGGSNTNGVVMLRTNAQNGATVSYDAIQASTGTNHLGTLRITGASCNAGNISTDGCIDAQGATQGTFTAGTEKFGMTIGGTNCGSTTSYSCSYSGATEHLVPSTNYIGAAANAYGTTNGFAWVESGAVTQIASAAASSPVDDEALVLRFAATPSITTPFGSYSVQTDFIAVPTY